MRAFTLLEMLVVVAILGIMAAIAVPNLQPLLRAEALRAAGHSTSAFVSRARMTALAEKRCVRVRIEQATAPAILVTEVLDSLDCEDTTSAGWKESARSTFDKGNLTVSFLSSPPDDELRFRPSGRVFSADLPFASAVPPADSVVLGVTHPELAGDMIRIVVEGTAVICTLGIGTTPVNGDTSSARCP